MDLSHATWRKSSRSTQNGSCVEITTASRGTPGHIIVIRDSKDPRGPVLPTTPASWRTFVNHVKTDGLNRT
jgi:hypothetical protein